MSSDLFPDSRSKITRGSIWNAKTNGWWIPVFCANCGEHGAYCPEESTHAFYLCNPCFEKLGPITSVMMVPDAEYYAKVAEEQQESFGRALTPLEIAKVREDNDTPLARLLLEAK